MNSKIQLLSKDAITKNDKPEAFTTDSRQRNIMLHSEEGAHVPNVTSVHSEGARIPNVMLAHSEAARIPSVKSVHSVELNKKLQESYAQQRRIEQLAMELGGLREEQVRVVVCFVYFRDPILRNLALSQVWLSFPFA